eukprot:TRINITY_DN1455_c0_g1_i2.p1 TRINITY_DN1455_c0_g1~~TRINITY_DN1455_c0_g1_i2.p1  ORF type:complete len:412 (-),score=60.17 TRINITY_DN1455_c0_g1_i2:106-1341(-)
MMGVGSLSAWNAMITANIDVYFNNNPNIEFFISIAYNLPSLFTLFGVLAWGEAIPLKYRLLVPFSLSIAFLIFIPIALTCFSQTFALVVVLVGTTVMGVCSSFLFSGSVGLASYFPSTYTTAVMVGVAAAGVFVGILRMVTLAVLPNNNNASTVLYFSSSAVILVTCIVLYLCCNKLSFVKYYSARKDGKRESDEADLLGVESMNSANDDLLAINAFTPTAWGDEYESDRGNEIKKKSTFWEIHRKVLMQGFNVFFVYFITLCLFPGMDLYLPNGRAGPTWFPVLIIFEFNLFDFIGRMLTFHPCLFIIPSKYLIIPNLVRVLFIVLIVMNIMGVLFVGAPWGYIFQGLMGLTNGYFGTLAMIYGTRDLKPSEQELGGFIMSFYLQIGLSLGGPAAIGVDKITQAINSTLG